MSLRKGRPVTGTLPAERPPATAPATTSLVFLMLVQFATGGSLYPFLTLYLLDRGLDQPRINGVLLAASAAATAMPFVWGWVADRVLAINRLIALLHLAAALVLFGVLGTRGFAPTLLLFALYGGLQHPTPALAHALCYHNLSDPPREFGRLRLWGSVGWMLPSLPIYLWHAWGATTDLRFAVYLTALLHLLLLLGSPLLPHTPPAARDARLRRAASSTGSRGRIRTYGRHLEELLSTPGYLVLLVVAFLMLSSFSIMFYHSGPALEEAGVPRRWIGPLLSLGVAFEIPLFLMLRRVLGRLGYRRTLVLGGLAAVVRHLVFAFSASPVSLAAASILVAPSVVFYLIAGSLVANSLAPRAVKATAQSLYSLAGSGLGTMHGLLVTSWITRQSGGSLAGAFGFAALCAAAAVFLVPWIRPGGPAAREKGPLTPG